MLEDGEPRTISGKRPSAATLQREREYIDWVNNLPHFAWLERPDRHRDESYEAFMAVRRHDRERARLKVVSARRSQHRHENRSAAAVERNNEYFDWLQNLPQPQFDDEELDDSWETFMKQRRQRRRNEARRTGGRRGRPIDPKSRRQQELAARAAAGSTAARRGRPVNPQRQQELAERAARREERQAEQRSRAAVQQLREAREKELAPLGIKRVVHRMCGRIIDAYYEVPSGAKPPEWMLSPDYTGFHWRVYCPAGRLAKWGPRKAEGPHVQWCAKACRWVSASGWDE